MRYCNFSVCLLAVMFALVLFPHGVTAEDSDTKWPPDARAVSMAVAGRIMGDADVSAIKFAPETASTMEGVESGCFSEFTRGVAFPLAYENDATGSNYIVNLSGAISLYDPDNRHAGFIFAARYNVDGDQITVRDCLSRTASPEQPYLEVYLLPVELFDGMPVDGETTETWQTFHSFVKENAYEPGDSASKQDWYVISFVMSRLPVGAVFAPVVSRERGGATEEGNLAKESERFFDYNGWRGHIFSARFKPGSLVDQYYINYYYTPGPDVPVEDRQRRLIARYETGK